MTTRRLSAAILVAAALLALGSCSQRGDWVMFRGVQGRGYTPTSLNPPLAVKWKLQLQVQAEPTYAFNNPVVVDDTIYFGSTDGNFYALDIGSGYMRWVFQTRGAINSIPFADESHVYFGNNLGEVYAVSRKQGEQSWKFQTDSTVQSSIVGYEDYLIFASDGSRLVTWTSDPEPELTLWRVWSGLVSWDARGTGLGGWTLSAHHAYDPRERVVYFGDGSTQSASVYGPMVLNVAGDPWGKPFPEAEGGPASAANLDFLGEIPLDAAIVFADLVTPLSVAAISYGAEYSMGK